MLEFNPMSGLLHANSPMHLFPILQDIKEINSIYSIVAIRDFVFSTIPLFLKPIDTIIDKDNVWNMYKQFLLLEAGGWCGLNADYFRSLLYWYQIKTHPYNFGISSLGITHMGVIVDYDGEEFFMDPYLAVHYVHKDGFLLTFKHLMALIVERKLDRIVPVFSDVCKPVEQHDGTFVMMTPQEIQKSMFMGRSPSGRPYEEVMKEVFGQTSPLLLMLINIVG